MILFEQLPSIYFFTYQQSVSLRFDQLKPSVFIKLDGFFICAFHVRKDLIDLLFLSERKSHLYQCAADSLTSAFFAYTKIIQIDITVLSVIIDR